MKNLAFIGLLFLSLPCFCDDAGQIFFDEGRKYTEENEYQKAAEYYIKAREAAPENPFYAYYLGWVYVFKLNEPEMAAMELGYALSEGYEEATVWQSYGRALLLTEKYREAAAAYKKASDLEYEDASVLRNNGDTEGASTLESRGAFYFFESGRIQYLNGNVEPGFQIMTEAWRNRVGYLADHIDSAYSSLLYEHGRIDLLQNAWRIEPESDRWTYFYGLALFQDEKYSEAAIILAELPPGYTSKSLLFLAESYSRSGNTAEAVKAAAKALEIPDNDQNIHSDYYQVLIKYLTELKDVNGLTKWQERALGYVRSTGITDSLMRYRIGTTYLDAAYKSAQSGETAKSLSLFSQAREVYRDGLGEYEANIVPWKSQLARALYKAGIADLAKNNPQNLEASFDAVEELCRPQAASSGSTENICTFIDTQNLSFFREVARYWDGSSEEAKEHAYHHRFLTLVFKKLKADWTDIDGTSHFHDNHFDLSVLDEYKKQFSIFSKIMFYISNGKILPFNEIRLLESTIVDFGPEIWTGEENESGPIETITYYSFSTETSRPYPEKILYEHRNLVDTFIYIAPTEGMPGPFARAQWGGLTFKPAQVVGKPRGGIYLSSGAAVHHISLLHEFFHNIEAAYTPVYPFIRHVFRPAYESMWPEWYSGEGELLYYKLAFEKILLPAGMDSLHFREDIDNTPDEILSLTNSIPPENIGTSIELFKKANEIYILDKETGIAQFHEVIELNPFHSAALLKLGTHYHWADNMEKAYDYIERAYEASPFDPTILYWMGVEHYHNDRYQEAVRFLTESLNYNPDSAAAYQYRGFLNYRLEKYADAKSDFESSLARSDAFKSWISEYLERRANQGDEEAREMVKALGLKSSPAR